MFFLTRPQVARFLERYGILCRWRATMTLELDHLRERPCLPPGYEICPWEPQRLEEVAAVDHQSYRNTLDARLYWPYFSTPSGCERMWQEAMNGRFGRFDPQRSLLLLHQGRVCGDVMASIPRTGEAFIGNLAVAPEHRGGTGTALLLTCLWQYREAAFQRVSLAVTLDNEPAYRLYSRVGFVVRHRFAHLARPALFRRTDRVT